MKACTLCICAFSISRALFHCVLVSCVFCLSYLHTSGRYKMPNTLSVITHLSNSPERSTDIRTVAELDKGADCAQ